MKTWTGVALLIAVATATVCWHQDLNKQDLTDLTQSTLAWSKQQIDYILEKLKSEQQKLGTSHKSSTEDLEFAACQLNGNVVDCACTYAAAEKVNQLQLWPTLEKLVKTPFFRYFKVNLYCDCPIWPDASQCFMKDCCVNECEEHEIPAPWREADRQKALCGEGEGEGGIDRTVEPGMENKLSSIRNWHGLNNPWVPDDDKDVEYVYINLQANPEKYTGYKGEDARRVWGAIYSQSCFEDIHEPDTCKEKQIFYRLISGMHSSITTHIVQDFYDEKTGTWGPNMPLFKFKFGNPDARPYVENLYFSYLFVLQAVMKMRSTLESFDFNTGVPEEDAYTKELVLNLVNNKQLQAACPTPFDEGILWQREDSAELKLQLQKHFKNITQIMDCVGCEKCKMWGKLQILGIATSLKILFNEPQPQEKIILDRNEVISLVNLLARLSESIETVRRLSLVLQKQENGKNGFGAITKSW